MTESANVTVEDKCSDCGEYLDDHCGECGECKCPEMHCEDCGKLYCDGECADDDDDDE